MNGTGNGGGESRSRQRSGSRSRSRSQSRTSRARSHSAFLSFITGDPSSTIDSYWHRTHRYKNRLFSLYSLLRIELDLPTDSLQGPSPSTSASAEANASYNELINMAQVPVYLEKFMIFGLLICLNSFLTLFTLIPLKIIIAGVTTARMVFKDFMAPGPSHGLSTKLQNHLGLVKKDFFTIVLIVSSLWVLSSPRLDISKMYHDIRGSAHIKLYVMFGVLEVTDKLCSSLGHEILNVFHSIPFPAQSKTNLLKFTTFFGLSVFYLSFHGYILIYQAISLNVAANSYSNALLALLLSNQFAELKSSVFKKFEREGLFQITMSDLCERFQLSIMLSMITLRNFLQLNSSAGLLPAYWKSWNSWFGSIFGPGIVVIGSEIIVDWLKHCYIAKFNKIRPQVYRNFLYVLSLDFLTVFKFGSSSSEADYIVLTKRIGLPLLATIVCFLRMTLADVSQLIIFPVKSSRFYSFLATTALILVTFSTLLLIRLLLALVTLKLANRIKIEHREYQQHIREAKMLVETPVSASPCPQKPASNITLPLDEVSGDETPDVSSVVPESPRSPVDFSFLPGIPNTDASSINPVTRSYLYDYGETVPPTIEERRNNQLLSKINQENDEDELGKVMRYEMSSKRIW